MKFLRFSGWPACGAAVLGALALGLGGAQAALAAPASGIIPVPCSTAALAYAISHAPNHATLGLVPSCTYTLYGTLPTVTKTLTISGSSDKIQRPFWASSFGLFVVSGYGNLTLTDLTLTGGRASKGGAIAAQGNSLTVINCYLAGNTATGDSGGGAIYNDGGSALSVLTSTLTGNVSYGPGGAVSNAGHFTALSDAFSANSAGGDGGAIYNDDVDLGPIAPAAGIAGLSGSSMLSMFLSGGSVIGNSSGYDGGGIAVYGGAGIKNALLNSNRARHHGGGLYNGDPGSATLLSTQVANNSAGDGGGGIYNDGNAVHLFGTTKVNYNEPDNCQPTGSILGCFL